VALAVVGGQGNRGQTLRIEAHILAGALDDANDAVGDVDLVVDRADAFARCGAIRGVEKIGLRIESAALVGDLLAELVGGLTDLVSGIGLGNRVAVG
jgi:hypothetical protein